MTDTSTSTTKKKASFLSTPLQTMCSLLQVPGIGPVTLERLTRAGIATPQQLVGQFMVLNRDTGAMVAWLKHTASVGRREAGVVAEALAEKTERMGVL